MKNKGLIISIILTIVYIGISYYWQYPAINLSNWGFWFYLIEIAIVFMILYSIFTLKENIRNIFNRKKYSFFKYYLFIPIIVVILIVFNFFQGPLFASKKYYERIVVDSTGVFDQEISEVDFTKLPLLDRDSTLKIGDRIMGQMSELVSQFDVSSQYTQINYNNEIIRVTPLEYNGLIKWATNRKEGIKAYITVNSTTGKANLVKLDKGMKYAPSAWFNENLYRKIQMSYPFKNIGKINFEIDNDGNPYWIASTVKYAGIGLREEVDGVIIFNPIDGKSKYYSVKDVPTWVDHVYDAELILEQVSDWGRFKNGFFNSIFGQKEVVDTTSGYNYLAQNDDIYLYTGITSVINDESNIGFILSNMRTKETKFYGVAGAEEYSAMDSAEGQVQQMKYKSTFPLLINLNHKPTYLVSLKDNAGLVKMYGFVDVVDYQKVVVTDSSKGIEVAAENYLMEINDDLNETGSEEKEIIIKDINSAIMDGNTYYYILDEEGTRYRASIKIDKDKLPFLKNGDQIKALIKKEKNIVVITDVLN